MLAIQLINKTVQALLIVTTAWYLRCNVRAMSLSTLTVVSVKAVEETKTACADLNRFQSCALYIGVLNKEGNGSRLHEQPEPKIGQGKPKKKNM